MRAPVLSRLNDVSILGPEYQKALREGKPELGWKGDPDLTITYHRLLGWEVLREEGYFSNGVWELRQIPVARQRPEAGVNLDINQLIRGLVARDTTVGNQSHEKAIDEYIQRYEKEEADRADQAYEAIAPVHEKLAWTVAKEAGGLAPVVSLAGINKPGGDTVD